MAVPPDDVPVRRRQRPRECAVHERGERALARDGHQKTSACGARGSSSRPEKYGPPCGSARGRGGAPARSPDPRRSRPPGQRDGREPRRLPRRRDPQRLGAAPVARARALRRRVRRAVAEPRERAVAVPVTAAGVGRMVVPAAAAALGGPVAGAARAAPHPSRDGAARVRRRDGAGQPYDHAAARAAHVREAARVVVEALDVRHRHASVRRSPPAQRSAQPRREDVHAAVIGGEPQLAVLAGGACVRARQEDVIGAGAGGERQQQQQREAGRRAI